MPIETSILSEIQHLQNLGDAERAALAERIELLSFHPGDLVFEFGDQGHAMYIVRTGEIEIFVKNDQGEKIVLEVSRPGDIFGEISLLDDGPRTASVLAITDVELLRLDRQHFEDYVRLYPPAALNLLSVVARRLRKSDELIRRTVSRNANDVTAEQGTLGGVVADTVAGWSGTVRSVLFHASLFSLYAVVNLGVIAGLRSFDPYPFGLLSTCLGMESILLTLIVLASQNRQKTRDQIRSDIEFESSINTELKIAHLHEKVDRLIESNYQTVVNTQRLLTGSSRRVE
jgi:CRP/FNR family cyclic AMP-dependent transcriptional regulator